MSLVSEFQSITLYKCIKVLISLWCSILSKLFFVNVSSFEGLHGNIEFLFTTEVIQGK